MKVELVGWFMPVFSVLERSRRIAGHPELYSEILSQN
jgi:hypothetical protein